MNTIAKYAVTGTVAALAIPAIALAAHPKFAARYAANWTGTGTGMHMPINSQAQALMQKLGITAPTADEMKAKMQQMQTVRDQWNKLSDADKKDIQNTADALAVQYRAKLREKGLSIPSEDDIAKEKAAHQAIEDKINALSDSDKALLQKAKHGFGGHHGGMMKDQGFGSGSFMPFGGFGLPFGK